MATATASCCDRERVGIIGVERTGHSARSASGALTALLVLIGVFCAATASARPSSPDDGSASPQTVPQASTSTATAQAGQDDVTAELGAIVVTAERVAQNQENVPIAITALSQATLSQNNILDTMQLSSFVPDLNLCCSTFNSTSYDYVRGVTSVPVYFDGVPYTQNGFTDYLDMESVQVLKGPQGTLFGEASNGGALVYQPNEPGETLDGQVRLAMGDYGRRTVEFDGDAPLAGGRILTRLSVISNNVDGYIHDLSNNQYYGNQDYYIIRAQVTFKITSNLDDKVLYQYENAKDNGEPDAWVVSDFNFLPYEYQNPNSVLYGTLQGEAALNGGSIAAFNTLRGQALATQFALGPYTVLGFPFGCPQTGQPYQSFIGSLNYPRDDCPGDWYTDSLLINTTDWNFAPNWTAKNIFGVHRPNSYAEGESADGSPLEIYDFGGVPGDVSPTSGPDTWSDEVQAIGNVGRFHITVGEFNTQTHTNPTPPIDFEEYLGYEFADFTTSSSRENAVYAQTDFKVTPRLTVTGGLRYTWDKVASETYNFNPTTLAFLGSTGGPDSPAGHAHFTDLSYTAGVHYQYTDRTMFYLTNSKGYSAGGLQDVPGFYVYQPDTLNNIELGVKSRFRLSDNVQALVDSSVYYGWLDNDQVEVWSNVVNPVTGGTSAMSVQENAAKAIIKGVDVDGSVLFGDNLELGLWAAYNDNVYTSWPSLNPYTLQPVSLTDTPFLWDPRWKVGGHATIHAPVNRDKVGDISFTASASWTDYTDSQAEPLVPLNSADPRSGWICNRARTVANGYPASVANGGTAWVDCTQPFWTVNATLDWNHPLGNDNLDAKVIMTNLTNTAVTTGHCVCDSSLGVTAQGVPPPREYYAELLYQF